MKNEEFNFLKNLEIMKRLFTISALTLIALTATAQSYQYWFDKADGCTYQPDIYSFTIDNTQHSVTAGDSVFAFDQLRGISLLRDGVRWNAPYKVFGDNQHYSWGYGSVMHLRDLMTGDMAGTNTGYNWYSYWETFDRAGKTVTNASGERFDRREVTNYSNQFVWTALRQLTQDANYTIESLKATESDELKGYLGAAYAERAMVYLDMARMYEFLPNEKTKPISSYGQDLTGLTVPIIDENTQPISQYVYNVPRATKQEMVAFLENDLNQAETLITNLTASSKVLPHLDAVYGLKARLYLWAEDYAKAQQYARRAIEASSVQPMTEEEMTNMQTGFNDLSKWMWGVQQFDYDRVVTSGIVNWSSWLSNEAFFGYANVSPNYISKQLYDQISRTDVRKLLFMPVEGDTLHVQTHRSDLAPYTSIKFRPNGGELDMNQIGAASAFPLMRVEEMYFIEAEAALQQGNNAEALALLSTFMRGYRDPDYSFTNSDRDALLDQIILQKRIELWGEGQTFFDIKRLNLSVTRDYEDTNFYPEAAINTNGRPWWMNMVIASREESYNIAVNGFNNPDPSDMQYVEPVDTTTAHRHLDGELQLHDFVFTQNIDVLPLDSVYIIDIVFNLPVDSIGDGVMFSVQMSLSPDFSIGNTAELYSVGNSNYPSFTLTQSAGELNNALNTLLSTEALAVPHELYFRVQVRPRCNQSVVLTSNTISMRAKAVPAAEYKYKFGYSYAPKFSVSPLGRPVDMEYFNKDTGLQFMNMQTENLTYVESLYLGLPEWWDFDASAGSLTSDGRLTSEAIETNLEYNFYPQFPGIITMPAYAWGYVYHDDLEFYVRTDTIDVDIMPNRQRYREKAYTWNEYANLLLKSGMETGGRDVTVQKAEGANIYRVLSPYETSDSYGYKGRNILLYTDPHDYAVTVPKQWALTDSVHGRVNVEGRGIHVDRNFTLQLDFTTEDGQVLGSFAEKIYDPNEDWVSLGYGTYTEDCLTTFWGVENVSYPVEVFENMNIPGYYRLKNPYGAAYPYNESGDWDSSKDYFLEIHAEDSTAVYIPDCNVGLDWDYGFVHIWSYAGYFMVNNGYTLQEAKEAGFCGTRNNGVITFPAQRLLIGMEAYNNLNWYTSNNNGAFKVLLPGFEEPIPDPVPERQYLYIPNSANGWNPATAPMIMGDYGSGSYHGYAYLGDEFKFTYERDWSSGECNASSFTSYPDGFGGEGTGNITNATPGYYYLDVTPGGEFKATLVSSVSIVGTFTDWDNDIELTYNPTNESWYGNISVREETEWKFRMNHAWELNLGGIDYSTSFDGTNSTYCELQQDGANLGFSQAGTYRITLHASLFDSEYMYCTVEKVESTSGDGTLEHPFSASEALSFVSSLAADAATESDYYIKGVISEIREVSPNYGNATYYISDDGTTNGSQFYIYRGLYLNNEKFTATDQIKVGDYVTICGKLVNYKGNSPETVANQSYIYSLDQAAVTRSGAKAHQHEQKKKRPLQLKNAMPFVPLKKQ